MTNNDILKKLRVALQLRNDEIAHILSLVNYEITKSELSALFRSEDHAHYKKCGDQILRNFLNGLVIYKRGVKDDETPWEENHEETDSGFKPVKPKFVPSAQRKEKEGKLIEKKPEAPAFQGGDAPRLRKRTNTGDMKAPVMLRKRKYNSDDNNSENE